MIPYYVLIGAPLLFALFRSLSFDRPLHPFPQKNYTTAIFFFLYFLLLALRRADIGVDTSSYVQSFSRFVNLSFADAILTTRWEVGFVFITKCLTFFFSSPQLYLAVMAALCTYPVAYMLYHETEDDASSLVLFLIFPNFIMLFSGVRQSLAMAFAPLVYYAVRERRLWRALLLAAAASTIHTSALILFVMYPLYHMKLRPKHLFWLIPGYIFTFLNSTRLYFLIKPLFGESYAANYGELTQTGATTMIILFSLFIAYAFIAPNEELMDPDTLGLRNILVLVLFIQMFSTISPLTMRMNYYFLPFIPLLIPKITHRITRVDIHYVQLIKIGMFAFFLLYQFLKIHTTDSLGIYPYAFFWQ